MRKFALCSIALFTVMVASSAVQAAVTFNVLAETLRDVGGTAMAQSGLVLLVSSTTDSSFGALSEGGSLDVNSLIGDGNDQILAKWNLITNGTDGLLLDTVSNLNFSGNWGANDAVALYWFPTLTLSSSSLIAGAAYGVWSGPPNAEDGGNAWITPGDGGTVSLNFLTDSASIGGTGTHPSSLGNASLTVAGVPEPSRMLLLLGGVLGVFMRRHRR